jgi:hypothetical protein
VTPLPSVEKMLVPSPVHVTPLSVDVAIELVPSPTATHRPPLNATPFPLFEKMDDPLPVQERPVEETAILLVPLPRPIQVWLIFFYKKKSQKNQQN